MTNPATPRRQLSPSTACTLVSASGCNVAAAPTAARTSATGVSVATARKSTPMRPPALAGSKPIRVSTLVRTPGGSRSMTGRRRLAELGDRVGRVVGPHLRQHVGDLAVRARAEQFGRPVLAQLLKDVRLQLGVRVDLPEDLGLLLLGGIFQQVGDLSRLQPPDPAERPAQQRTARMPDQRLECLPVPETLGASRVRRPGRSDMQGPSSRGGRRRASRPTTTSPSLRRSSSTSAARTRRAVSTSISR